MPFPVPHFQPKPDYQPPAIVRNALREDVLWNRPIFKAPPLIVHPPIFEEPTLDDELPELAEGFR